MKTSILVSESTLTERYQTTVPDPIRKVLGLKKREKIRYTVQPNGDVILTRVTASEEDPVVGRFLEFLAQDMADSPSRIGSMGEDLKNHIDSLTAGIDVDLDAPLSDEDN